ncbi:MAG: putative tRNA(Ile)-lysidine synthetase, TilS [Pseudomonadota bacterium]|jgi:tRNA(Ile)-lysidine synthase
MAGLGPLTAGEMAALMAPLGPFEPAPRIAVALSGGPDSMALALLLHEWARAQGGGITTLTVDHGLRPGSAAEAGQVAAWMRTRGIPHHILTWTGQKPATGVQEAARRARYDLLTDWCRRSGILHLALGHQRDDQAETVALRRIARSGPDGLAAMAAIRELTDLRLIRPLLGIPRARLAATCEAAGQAHVTDPSNQDPRHARVRTRDTLTDGDRQRLAREAGEAGHARAAAETRLARTLADHATFHAEGWVELAAGVVEVLPAEEGMRLLVRLIGAVSGQPYPPRLERVDRTLTRLRAGVGGRFSLGGCLVEAGRQTMRLMREPAAVAPPVTIGPGGTGIWDGRFRLTSPGDFTVTLGALGPGMPVPDLGQEGRRLYARLPAAVRRTLPCIRGPCVRREDSILHIPHLSYVGPDGPPVSYDIVAPVSVPAVMVRFSVVMPAEGII